MTPLVVSRSEQLWNGKVIWYLFPSVDVPFCSVYSPVVGERQKSPSRPSACPSETPEDEVKGQEQVTHDCPDLLPKKCNLTSSWPSGFYKLKESYRIVNSSFITLTDCVSCVLLERSTWQVLRLAARGSWRAVVAPHVNPLLPASPTLLGKAKCSGTAATCFITEAPCWKIVTLSWWLLTMRDYIMGLKVFRDRRMLFDQTAIYYCYGLLLSFEERWCCLGLGKVRISFLPSVFQITDLLRTTLPKKENLSFFFCRLHSAIWFILIF